MADLVLDPVDAISLQEGEPVTVPTEQGNSVVIDSTQISEANWATLDSGGSVMVLAPIVGQNIMTETYVTT